MQSPAKTSAQTSAAHLNPCLKLSCHLVATSPSPKGPRLGGLAPNGDTGGVLWAGSPATSVHGPLPSSPAFCSWSSSSSSRCTPQGGIWPVASSGEVCKRVFAQQGGAASTEPGWPRAGSEKVQGSSQTVCSAQSAFNQTPAFLPRTNPTRGLEIRNRGRGGHRFLTAPFPHQLLNTGS